MFLSVPEGVSGPYNVYAASGYVIEASWRRPIGRTGQITHYILRAYNEQDSSLPPVEAVFQNTTYTSGELLYFCYFIVTLDHLRNNHPWCQ